MFTPQASHICPSPGVSSTFFILPCGRRPPSSLRRMTKRTTSRSIKSYLSNLETATPHRDSNPDATVLDYRDDIIHVPRGVVNSVARHLSRPSALLPAAVIPIEEPGWT